MQFFKKQEEQLDTSAEARKERSYLWMARVFALVCAVTLIADLILLGAVESLLPLTRVQPFFIVTQDKDKQIIKIERPRREFLSSKFLQESFVRQYIMARFLIGTDMKELDRRWGTNGTVQWMSTGTVFDEFNDKYAEGLIREARENGLTRDVGILNVRRDPREDGQIVWIAEVRLTDISRSLSKPKITDLQVTMIINFGSFRENLTWEQRLKNPLGFEVKGWGQKDLTMREREEREENKRKNENS